MRTQGRCLLPQRTCLKGPKPWSSLKGFKETTMWASCRFEMLWFINYVNPRRSKENENFTFDLLVVVETVSFVTQGGLGLTI